MDDIKQTEDGYKKDQQVYEAVKKTIGKLEVRGRTFVYLAASKLVSVSGLCSRKVVCGCRVNHNNGWRPEPRRPKRSVNYFRSHQMAQQTCGWPRKNKKLAKGFCAFIKLKSALSNIHFSFW